MRWSAVSYPPPPTDPESLNQLLEGLRAAAANAVTDRQVRDLTARIASITRTYRIKHRIGLPADPLSQAREIDPAYRPRPHLTFLADRVSAAVRDVEAGVNRMMAVSMPPRSGKSMELSLFTPLWTLRGHPDWKIVTVSYDPALTAAWARQDRRLIEANPELGIALAPDSGSGTDWRTEEGGGIFATSIRGSFTGRGVKVLIIDDPIKDFVDAHSAVMRQALWDWWLSVAQTRLEPPYLVLVVMTRWHEDDLIGRLLSREHEGDPADWEVISLAALAKANDPLGRAEGEPLLSPLSDETPEEAITRWEGVRRTVGSYVFAAMYQQEPSPAKGAIFDTGWWRYWTSDPGKETSDGRVRYLDPASLTGARWVDSWDCAFKDPDSAAGGKQRKQRKQGGSSYVVGQRWVRSGANRYLIAQVRDRWNFVRTVEAMQTWARPLDPVASPYGHLVHQRIVEDKANGPAILAVLQDRISGLKPANPTVSKEARARAITPEVESGNVYLPHPDDPGNEWVADLLSELRNFPYDAHDDQVDALTQALSELRDEGRGGLTVPGRAALAQAATRTAARPVVAGQHLGRDNRAGAPQAAPRPSRTARREEGIVTVMSRGYFDQRGNYVPHVPAGPPPDTPAGSTCPECAAGKHDNCRGDAWDDALDDPTICACWDRGHTP